MGYYVILGCFFLLCIGQVWALTRGRLAGAIYYLCVAPLGYFAVWYYASWGTMNVCALLLIVGGVLSDLWNGRRVSLFGAWGWVLLLYGVFVTLIGVGSWPIEAMGTTSATYRELRVLVQLNNWFVQIGAAWQIALAFSEPGAFQKARPYLLAVGVVLCVYAYYQFVAYRVGLPATGIGRMVVATGEEERASFTIGGEEIYRPGSFVGEPKGLGVGIIFWLAVLIAGRFSGRAGKADGIVMLTFLIALLLTSSTSAWASALCMVGLSLYALPRWGGSAIMGVRGIVLVLVAGLAVTGVALLLFPNMGEIVWYRFVERMQDPVSDLPEVTALEVLKNNPSLAIFGTGLGGISFYIAEALGGEQTLILFPNNGLLGMVCNVGVVGVVLVVLSCWAGIWMLLFARVPADRSRGCVALVGLVLLVQCFILPQPYAFSAALGFLWAATRSPDQFVPYGRRIRVSVSG